MAKADLLFNILVGKILKEGKWQKPESVRAKWGDGTPAPAKSVLNIKWQFDKLEDEVPILTNKKINPEKPALETDWIWKDKSNVVQDLRDKGVGIWDKWENKDPNSEWFGTIGPAYGWQLATKKVPWKCSNVNRDHLKDRGEFYPITESGIVLLDQVDNLIQTLLTNPGSRRVITTLWGVQDIPEMMLTPCVWATQWSVWDDKLHLTVQIRSNDICVGNPFNVFQYYLLMRQIGQVVGIPCGTITFDIVDAHIYDRHVDLVQEQIKRPIHKAPKLWLNPDIKNFYEFTINDFKLVDYVSEPFIKYEVAE